MHIYLNLFTNLEKYYPIATKGPQNMSLETSSTVAHLIKMLGMPDEPKVLTMVNGQPSDISTVLTDNDEVYFFYHPQIVTNKKRQKQPMADKEKLFFNSTF
jgi:sulfur carrier protein ThiS